MPEERTDQRTRMNFGMNSKGFVQMDITVEYATPEECEFYGADAIDRYRRICTEKGLKLASEA